MDNKELAIVEEQVKKCLVSTKDIVVTNQEEYDQAYLVGKKVAALAKLIDDKEKSITKPINDSLKKIRDMFRPFKTQVEAVSDDLKAKRTRWIQEEETKKRKEEERIAARVEKGTMKEETAVTKLANIEAAAPVTSGGMTSVLRVKLVDITQVPAQYLILNESKIKEDHRAGIEIPGVICEYEKVARN